MAQVTLKERMLRQGMEGLIDLYYRNDMQALYFDIYRYIGNAPAKYTDTNYDFDQNEYERYCNQCWDRFLIKTDTTTILEDINKFLILFFTGKQPTLDDYYFSDPVPSERWYIWRFQTFRPIEVNADHIILFTRIMASLQETILNKKYTQFMVERREYIESFVNEIEPGAITKVTRKPREKRWKYTISAHDVFGLQLLEWYPEQEPLNVVQDIETGEFSNFFQLVRAILINFHIEYGGYEKLATCSICGKLIYKRRLRKEPTCSQACRSRKAFNEDVDRTRCRNRQTGFLANAKARVVNIPYQGISVSDCRECSVADVTKVRFGGCPILRQRNQRFVEEFEKVKWKHLSGK